MVLTPCSKGRSLGSLLSRGRALVTFAALALGAVAGCTSGGGPSPAPEPLDIPDDPDCDPLVPGHCAMPFPSSYYLEEDATRVTGYTLAFGPTTLPANGDGVHVDPSTYRRLDGFGVGQPAVVYLPRVDASKLPDETRIAESMDDDSPVALFQVDLAGGDFVRIPCWAELDLTDDSPEHRALVVRPAVLLEEGKRYVLAFRGLVDVDGAPIAPSDAFLALRDVRSAGTPVEGRQAHFDMLFAGLEAAGLAREDLTLAFDWVTASSEALHGPLLHMRDDAFATLGDARPAFTVTSVTPFTPEENEHIAYELEGTFTVPSYLRDLAVSVQTGSELNLGADGLPEQNGTMEAGFLMRVPRSAIPAVPGEAGPAHGAFIHGHGLNGTYGQVRGGWMSELANQEGFIVVGTNMIGMSDDDTSVIFSLIGDLSYFRAMSDRLHQGVLNHAFLARALKRGLDELPELAALGVVIDEDQVYYNGISQGGIFGGTHMAMSLDITRGQLGVPGNNYSTLLQRSSDFGPFFAILQAVYQDPHDRQVLLSTIQALWDSVDPVSHYRHIKAAPHPGTPPHDVLLASATGDWQVALVTNEIVARSNVGISLLPGYGRDVALVTPTPYPVVGSGLVNYSFGNPWPEPGNMPPYDDLGDPHGLPRNLAWHNAQMVHFWRTGEIIDVCGGDGCSPD